MKILVSDKLDARSVEWLVGRGFDVVERANLSPAQLAAEVKDADGWIVRSGTQVTDALLAEAPKLRVVGRAGVGVDNIDVPAATRRGIAVLNTPTGNTTAAVEHTMALLLSLARHVPAAHASLVLERRWERNRFLGVELYGKSMGVLGLGKIGSRVATRCRAFEMTVLAFDPYLSARRAEELGVELVGTVDDLLARSDFLSVHLPMTDETRGMIGADRLARARKGIRIVNCARGGLIDERALADALASGHVAGAAVDVFETEPALDSPLLSAPNVVLTPHLGASTVESQQKVGTMIAEQVAEALERGVFREAVNIPVRDWATWEKQRPQLELVERLGKVAQQFVDGGITRVEVEYQGGPFAEIPAINNTLLKGLLWPILGESVNTVNAPLLAAERGIVLAHTTRQDSSGYSSLVRLAIRADGRERTFAGTCFGRSQPRIVELDGAALEFIPQGILLVFVNLDRPGVIGAVGSLLGRHQINIASFTLGRTARGGEALAVLQVDDAVPPKVREELAGLESMKWVKQIVLDP